MSEPEPPVDRGDESDPGQASRVERLRRDRRRRNLRRGLLSVAVVVVLALVGGVALWLKLNGNISRVDLSRGMGNRPGNSSSADPNTNLSALNIMVIGSDSRAKGESGDGGNSSIKGQRSDTNLIVHLSANRKSAIVVSIPRDSMTMAPTDCNDPESTVQNGFVNQWNDNFARGGEACTAKTIEGLTGIRIDHSVTIDFVGFKTMVDALGGVEVCTPKAIDDKDAHLVLPAGRQRLDGEQALGYVRVRETLGNGSDIERIDRQQVFLSSMIQEATNTKLLLRPDKLFRFLNAATSSMTADEGLGLGSMTDIAQSLGRIGIDNINFLTVPIEAYAPDPNRVQWAPAADALWKAMREDKPLPGTKAAKSATATSTPTPTTPSLTVKPDDITVRVVNSSGAEGLAVQAAAALRPQGFIVAGLTNGTGDAPPGVVIRHTAEQAEAAKTVAAAFPGAKLEKVTTEQSSIEVILGEKAPDVVEVSNRTGDDPLPDQPITATAPGSSTPSFTARTADTDICS